MDYRCLTIGDCIRKHEREFLAAVIENGAITGFVKERRPCQYRKYQQGQVTRQPIKLKGMQVL